MSHHPIFDRFKGFSGVEPEGFVVDWLGVLCEEQMLDPGAVGTPAREVRIEEGLACTGEGYFDLISVLRSVDEAKGRFTMIELGAGYGYWLSQGALAARQRGLPFHLVGVEAEPTHYAMMLRHLRNNGVDPAGHRILHAAVTMHGGEAWFQTGQAHAWWGQEVIAHPEAYTPPAGSAVEKVAAVSLGELLEPLERVDVIHMDVQGLEHNVLVSALQAVSQKVRRVVVGTHNEGVEASIREMLGAWDREFDFPMGQTSPSDFGPVTFGDGLQVYANPALG